MVSVGESARLMSGRPVDRSHLPGPCLHSSMAERRVVGANIVVRFHVQVPITSASARARLGLQNQSQQVRLLSPVPVPRLNVHGGGVMSPTGTSAGLVARVLVGDPLHDAA